MIYPWQTETWQRLEQLGSRIPHALLFSGLPGIGKSALAAHFIRSLICTAQTAVETPSACCHACRLFAGKSHPDVLSVSPEGKSSTIKVEQIRDVIHFVSQSSLMGKYRFVLLSQADGMNNNAANALLKTLEEPAADAIIILLATQTGKLLPTILSRCHHVPMPVPSQEIALQWLQTHNPQATVANEVLLALANGAPLAALAWADAKRLTLRQSVFRQMQALSTGFVKECAAWGNEEMGLFMQLVMSWVLDVLRLKLGASAQCIHNSDFLPELTTAQASITMPQISYFLQHWQWLQKQIALNFNLNPTLLYENLLITWHGLQLRRAV